MDAFDAFCKYNSLTTYWGTFWGILSGFTYGALHCILWNAHFPTQAERLFWRISSLYMVIYPIFFHCRLPFLYQFQFESHDIYMDTHSTLSTSSCGKDIYFC